VSSMPDHASLTDALRQCPFFAELDDQALAQVARQVIRRTFRRGEMILLEGEPCPGVYFIVRGQVRVYRLSPEGREQVLKRLGPGEALNLVPALDGGPNPSTALAWTDVTVLFMGRENFLRMLYDHPAVAVAMLQDCAGKLRHMTSLAADLSLRSVGARLAKLLLRLAAEESTEPHRLTRQEMAAQLGTVREMVSRALRQFEAEGLIRMERHRIVIVNRAELEKRAML